MIGKDINTQFTLTKFLPSLSHAFTHTDSHPPHIHMEKKQLNIRKHFHLRFYVAVAQFCDLFEKNNNVSSLTCAESVRRLWGVNRVMILQKLHLCEIPDSSLSPGCTPLHRPFSHNPQIDPTRLLSLWRRAVAGPALCGRPGNRAQLHRELSFIIDALFYFFFYDLLGRRESEWVVKEIFSVLRDIWILLSSLY